MSLASQRGSQLLRQRKKAMPARPAAGPRAKQRQPKPTHSSKVKNWLMSAAILMLIRQLFEWVTGGWG